MIGETRADSTASRSFTFINRTGNPLSTDQKDDDISTIRSHAITVARRRKILASEKFMQSKSKPDASTTPKDGDTYRLTTRPSPYWLTTHGRTFSSRYSGTAIKLHGPSSDMSQHLHYFIYGFTPLTFPTTYVRHRCDILRLAASEGDAGLLHALCAVSAIHRALVQHPTTSNGFSPTLAVEDPVGRTFLRHKQNAIMSLQKSLSRSISPYDQSSLAVVAVLLMIESLSGDTSTANAHQSGLLRLVECYRGTQEPSSFLTADVLMTDIKSATSNLSQPLIGLCTKWTLEFNRLQQLPFVPHRPDLVSLGTGFLIRTTKQYLRPEMVLLIRAMQKLINAVEQNFDMGIDVSHVNGGHVLVMEHQLLSVSSGHAIDKGLNNRFGECCRIAALLYCNLCLWNWPKNSTLITNLLYHFRIALSQWQSELQAPEQISAWLWLCFIGSFATSSEEGFEWYLISMQNASRWLGLKTEDHFRTTLARFFYVDRLMGQHLKIVTDYLCHAQ